MIRHEWSSDGVGRRRRRSSAGDDETRCPDRLVDTRIVAVPVCRSDHNRNVVVRPAVVGDVASIASLHAESWRRFYRGAYADAYLDGDLYTDRLAVWQQRFERADERARTLVAEGEGGDVIAFMHAILHEDPRWGALVDNLHVSPGHHRRGIGTSMLADALRLSRESGTGLYLWVQEQNAAAQAFYLAQGAVVCERTPISPPGGVRSRLVGAPMKLRCVWSLHQVLVPPPPIRRHPPTTSASARIR